MKITDMLISGILRKGVIYEARNCDTELEIPMLRENEKGGTEEVKINVRFKVEHMTIRVEKGRE